MFKLSCKCLCIPYSNTYFIKKKPSHPINFIKQQDRCFPDLRNVLNSDYIEYYK